MYNLYYIIVPNIFSANEKGKNKYARMTEEQRTNRRKRQNTLEACQQKKNHCNMKKDALCVESIAMDNPLWDPEMQSTKEESLQYEKRCSLCRVYCNGQPIVGPRDAVTNFSSSECGNS
jgi:hypothetical protein